MKGQYGEFNRGLSPILRRQVQVGVTRVPFGPGPYGVSQSWFFDQHYYVGLADDMDFGLKYLTHRGDWELAFAYFLSSEGNWNGGSEDSARYSYDPVRWKSGIEPNGDIVEAPVNGYEERNQFNMRAVYQLEEVRLPTNVGISMQSGELDGKRAKDGHHWAVSGHMINTYGNFTLSSQLTHYEFDVDSSSSGTDYLLPYIEYSSTVKDDSEFNDGEMFVFGSAWSSGGWYIYSDLAYSNGNLFVGNKGDSYSNIYDGVGDFGVAGNDKWNYRFNLNLGYYY